jgi:acetyl-CoA carboxylase biotin carboxylase subunit
MKIKRVLIANRGEIAVRIIKACKELGIETVVVVSEADKDSLPARMADRAICIGPPRPIDSYLNIDALIYAARGTNCDAIHPGYGFLAEQPELAEACIKYGIIFIGPSPENLRQMGDKLLARKIVRDFGIPIIPGSEKINNFEEALRKCEEMKFPVLLKASAGGGGRGIKIVNNMEELKIAFDKAAAEAKAAFGDETLYIEHYITNARHIEVQVIADHFGNVIHVGERDCSLQRRYQKIIEEAPAPSISSEIREAIRNAGVTIAKKMNYRSVGTVEFIFDQDEKKFYFLEMNTRIQVEHPVTEMISGIDLVKEQIKIASDHPLCLSQSDVTLQGHAIECRINAESPKEGFQPFPGRITEWLLPNENGIRIDTHCYKGYFVPPFYDSLIAKVITSGKNRGEAIKRMKKALESFVIKGIETTIPFLKYILNHRDFIECKINTRWIEERLSNEFLRMS